MLNRIRNIRKRWIIISVIGALLAIGLVSGAVLAADARSDLANHSLNNGYGHGRHGKGQSDALLLRVAEILGIERSTLESAFATAIDEQAETKFNDHVAQLVADETLTQEQAGAATSWFGARPANSGPIAMRLAGAADSGRVDSFLAEMVEKEKITQDESDSLSEWHDDRPESLPEAERKRRRHHDGHRNDDSSDDSSGDSA